MQPEKVGGYCKSSIWSNILVGVWKEAFADLVFWKRATIHCHSVCTLFKVDTWKVGKGHFFCRMLGQKSHRKIHNVQISIHISYICILYNDQYLVAIGSMYGIIISLCTFSWCLFVNVGKYTIHWVFGIRLLTPHWYQARISHEIYHTWILWGTSSFIVHMLRLGAYILFHWPARSSGNAKQQGIWTSRPRPTTVGPLIFAPVCQTCIKEPSGRKSSKDMWYIIYYPTEI